jgi:hypothetical protein
MGNAIEKKFEKMGARVKVSSDPLARLSIDIRRDRLGEYFDVRHDREIEVQVVDVKPADRHLLLMTRRLHPHDGEARNSKFLCGHDERSWFVAAIPESAHAKDVQSAKDALKPAEVWESIRKHGVTGKDRNRRKTSAFLRQGEWFFLPRPWMTVAETLVLKNEPIRRGAGKPHICQYLHRHGGQVVWVSERYPNGLTEAEFAKLSPRELQKPDWRQMARDARVYVKGSVRHPDHKTIWLAYWHQVVMNTETRAAAMRNVAFLD